MDDTTNPPDPAHGAADWTLPGLAETLADATTDMLCVVDAGLRVVFANRAFADTFGVKAAEAGAPLLSDADGLVDAAFAARVGDAVRMQGGWDGEIWFRRADGGVFPAWVRLRTVTGAIDTRANRRVLAVIHDLARNRDEGDVSTSPDHGDSLTGLPNRHGMMELLYQAMANASARGEGCAVILVDLDDFQSVNDRFGHGLGDRILIDRSKQVKAVLRDGDALGRPGGDQYMILVRRFPALSEVDRVVRRVLEAIAEPFVPEGRSEEVRLTACAGVALYPRDGNTASGIEQAAETAYLLAKRTGPGSYRFYGDDEGDDAPEPVTLERRLRKALEAGEFLLYYQPKVSLKTGRIVGAEALVRWRDPQNGLVEPSDFIPVAEETGLIAPLGLWTLETACREAQRLRGLGLDPGRMAVNVSARQASDRATIDGVFDVLRRTGLPATSLEIEVTESALLERAEQAAQGLRELREAGVQITADDFGTGYASLSYLLTFPIDAIKIDRTFVAEIGGGGDGANLAIGVTALAQGLNKRVIAEGVETPRQLAVLRQQMCDEMQGDHFSPPLPADEFEALLRANQSA